MATGRQLPLAKPDQLGVEAQEALLAGPPLGLIQGAERLPQWQRAAQPVADAIEGAGQPLFAVVRGDPVLLRHPPQGQGQAVRQQDVIRQQLAIALAQEAGQGLCGKLRPVPAEPVVIEHVDQDAAKAAPGCLEAADGGPVLGMRVGEGIYLAVQPDPLVKGGTQGARQRSLDEVPQQIAGEGAVGVGG
ncbi:hypothetical protein D3C80_1564350 [compost metagenome]